MGRLFLATEAEVIYLGDKPEEFVDSGPTIKALVSMIKIVGLSYNHRYWLYHVVQIWRTRKFSYTRTAMGHDGVLF